MASTLKKKEPTESSLRQAAIIVIVCLLFFGPRAVWCGPVVGPEYEVKLGFIYNFANFVTWPQDAFKDNPEVLVVCFASDDPTSEVFFKLDGKVIKGRKIKVVAFQQGDCLAQSHILFFGTQDKAFIQQVLSQANGLSILTIGEVDGFTLLGGVIEFFQESNRLRFKINIDAARRQGLKMSAQLLGSAQIVTEEHE